MKLNPQQDAAVKCIDRPLLVLAGAGSGKTRVITEKMVYLIKTCGMQAHHIGAVTFTNKAAKEMQARLQQHLSRQQTRGLIISTFHTLGLRILRAHADILGYTPHFSIYDETDCLQLLKSIDTWQAFSKDTLRYHLKCISDWKSHFISPQHALSHAKDELESQSAHMYLDYQKHLKAFQAVDFDDLIALPVQLLQTNEKALAKWRQRLRYLLVDEYQDTNQAQYELVKLLVQERQTFTVVGDDDQSIYTWRGAKPENLLHLQQDFPRLKVIKLEQNYRSTNTILNAANRLISHNPHVFEKVLWSEHGQGNRIRVIHTPNEQAEAERVVSDLIRTQFDHKLRYRDFAILYRGNFQAQLLEQQLRAHRIPYRINGGTSLFSRVEIRDLMSYLKILVNPADNAALLRVINTPRRGIGAGLLEKLNHYAQQRNLPIVTVLQDLGLKSQLSPKQEQALHHFAQLIDQGSHWIKQNLSPQALIDQLLEQIDYSSWLSEISSSSIQADKRWQYLQNFKDWLEKLYQRKCEDNPDFTLSELLNTVILIDQLDQQEEEDNLDQVQLLTLHAAKGLEFPNVYLLGFEENLLPHRTSIEEDNIVEERRLAYVGITRAQKNLTLTLAQTRKYQGEKIRTEPSRFLTELPEELIVQDNPFALGNKEEQTQRNQGNIAALRAMLNRE